MVLDEGLPLHPLQEQRDSVRDWRQIGLGVFGLADALIKMEIKYGNDALPFIDEIGKRLINESLYASAMLAKKDGVYPKYNNLILDSEFFKSNVTDFVKDTVQQYGLRNSQLLTCAPTGSLASLFNTSGSAESLFATSYNRRTISLNNKETIYKIYPKIIQNLIEQGYTEDTLPEYVVTAHQIPYKERLNVQATLNKYIDASISSTCNVDESITIEEIADLYLYAWQVGCKGVTIWRNNCKRAGILTTSSTPTQITDCPKRPEKLPAKLIRFKNGKENWIAFIGLLNNKPYEIFTGINNVDDFPVPTTIDEGTIVKVKDSEGKRYDFVYTDKYGYTNRLGGLSRIFNQEYWNYAKLISALLRGGIELDKVIKIIDGMNLDSDTLNSWKSGVKRALKTFVEDGTTSSEKCPECNENLIYTGGCTSCPSCGYSKCG